MSKTSNSTRSQEFPKRLSKLAGESWISSIDNRYIYIPRYLTILCENKYATYIAVKLSSPIKQGINLVYLFKWSPYTKKHCSNIMAFILHDSKLVFEISKQWNKLVDNVESLIHLYTSYWADLLLVL